MVTEKVLTSPEAMLSPRSPWWTERMAESRSPASHDSRPVTVTSVEPSIWTVTDRPSRASPVPLAMVPETVRSCPEVMTSGARESTESVAWPSIIWAFAGGVVGAAVPAASG